MAGIMFNALQQYQFVMYTCTDTAVMRHIST